MSIQTRAGFVAICGRPNAGKSTLLNAVLESEVSIVSPKAQTTRERVLGILSSKNRQLVFVDTPGIHKAKPGGINEYMVREASQALEDVSVVWYLIDPESELKHEEVVLEILSRAKAPVFLILNKADLLKNDADSVAARDEAVDELKKKAAEKGISIERFFVVSAKKKLLLSPLLKATEEKLPESPFYYDDIDQISDRPTRFFVGEKVREQLLACLGEEVPYSCAVEIEKFDEKAKPWRIEAVIHVERDSQKGIVIGQGAKKIKEIGTKARASIEKFLGEKVFLGLKVKVLPEWTRDRSRLERLGYVLPKEANPLKKSGKK
jgi:GTP-binding protein Era